MSSLPQSLQDTPEAMYRSGVYAPAILGNAVAKQQEAEGWLGKLPPEHMLAKVYAESSVDYGLLYSEAANDLEMEETYLTSKLWRLNNLYTIVDKDGERVPFVMNMSQHRVYAAIMKWYRLLILKSRQQGISTFWLLCYLDDALFYDDLNIGLMAQGKAESNKLLKRVKLAWRGLDPSVKDLLEKIGIIVDNKDEIGFSNNSTIFIQVSFRSATLQRLHVSELGKIANQNPERARELKTGTMQAIKPGNPIVVESTADGDNMFREMWDAAMSIEHSDQERGPKDFYPLFLSWVDDPDCNSYVDEHVPQNVAKYFLEIEAELGVTLTKSQKNFWIMQKRELEDDIYQEYPSTATEAFISVKDGTYYARLYMKYVILGGRERDDLYEPRLSVQVAIDLGMNDTFVMVYFQRWNDEWRIIDEYYNSGYGIKHYVEHMFNSKYTITNVELPHDGNVRELQTGKTREAYMRELGVTNVHTLERSSREDGIDRVRKVVPKLWIDKRCVYLKSCIKGYTKEWDEKHTVWKNNPLHNEYSNGADAVRVMATGKCINSKQIGSTGRAKKNGSVVNGLAL